VFSKYVELKNKLNMKYELKITDENGNEYLYNVVRSSSDEPKNLNDFILEALLISEIMFLIIVWFECFFTVKFGECIIF
jgi:hypothetical protein